MYSSPRMFIVNPTIGLFLVAAALLSGVVAGAQGAKVPPPPARLQIELVPVRFVGVSSGAAETTAHVLSTTHRALSILGVMPNEYALTIVDGDEGLECGFLEFFCSRHSPTAEWHDCCVGVPARAGL